MLVMPLLQTSLAFRMLFSTWLNPNHEIFGPLVLSGVVISIAGALMVSIDTGLILTTLAMPDAARPHAALAGVSYLPLSM